MPTKLKSIKHKIISVSLGPEHTACLTEAGHILTFGRNSEGQLEVTNGGLDRDPPNQPVLVVQVGKSLC